jgi:hypothetical protein
MKIQVLSITPREKRTYSGRSWYQRQLQCFGNDKVFVHTQNCSADETEEALKEQQDLDSMQHGYYMAELDLQQGDRAKPNFVIRNLKPIKQGAQASV